MKCELGVASWLSPSTQTYMGIYRSRLGERRRSIRACASRLCSHFRPGWLSKCPASEHGLHLDHGGLFQIPPMRLQCILEKYIFPSFVRRRFTQTDNTVIERYFLQNAMKVKYLHIRNLKSGFLLNVGSAAEASSQMRHLV